MFWQMTDYSNMIKNHEYENILKSIKDDNSHQFGIIITQLAVMGFTKEQRMNLLTGMIQLKVYNEFIKCGISDDENRSYAIMLLKEASDDMNFAKILTNKPISTIEPKFSKED